MKRFIGLLIATALHASPTHLEKGTNYGEAGVNIYAQTKHGPDGALFLDPFFLPFLENLEGTVLLDAGCGAGPWSLVAAKQGATVYGIDIQESMIEKARSAAKKEDLSDLALFQVGDVGSLPFSDHFFDKAISINVGCNLPSLKPHIKELHRVLKQGGQALLTAPTSFEVVFTDGKRPIEEVIETIQLSLQDPSFPKPLEELDEVYRATFKKTWDLLIDAKNLEEGEKIWRKIPQMIVPNYYHSQGAYFKAFEDEGFLIKEFLSPKFFSEDQWIEHQFSGKQSLDSSYIHHSPFLIFIVEKI